MFPTHIRLPRYEIDNIFSKGQKVKGDIFDLLYLKTKNTHPRFAIIVLTKTTKRAVTKNRIKRLVREAVRGSTSLLNHSIDLVILVKKDISKYSSPKTAQVLKDLFSKI